MEAELVALATTGATALVQHMVGDGWERARTRVAEFFAGRFGADAESVGAELETVRDELLAAERDGDEQAAADARAEALAEWRARMRRSLRDDPDAADELREILAELDVPTGGKGEAPTIHISNSISGGVAHHTVIQAGMVGRMYNGDGRGTGGATP
ncbi:hypothetical protein [Streptomyces vilmorinianum]|uniref:hypothetical protein n=1 Tax=Streptomyces vilmorinianum TaxID=3051092 RepID=UPI0010FB895D|nr:hypothetical protein [Streptomyces vilmorinianum]